MTFQSPFPRLPFYPTDRFDPVNPWKRKRKRGFVSALRKARKAAKASRRRNR